MFLQRLSGNGINAVEATAVISAATGVIDTIVGAFFGINVGAKVGEPGIEKEKAERKIAEDKAFLLAGKLEPADFEKIKTQLL